MHDPRGYSETVVTGLIEQDHPRIWTSLIVGVLARSLQPRLELRQCQRSMRECVFLLLIPLRIRHAFNFEDRIPALALSVNASNSSEPYDGTLTYQNQLALLQVRSCPTTLQLCFSRQKGAGFVDLPKPSPRTTLAHVLGPHNTRTCIPHRRSCLHKLVIGCLDLRGQGL